MVQEFTLAIEVIEELVWGGIGVEDKIMMGEVKTIHCHAWSAARERNI